MDIEEIYYILRDISDELGRLNVELLTSKIEAAKEVAGIVFSTSLGLLEAQQKLSDILVDRYNKGECHCVEQGGMGYTCEKCSNG